jgi:hypothetical protein
MLTPRLALRLFETERGSDETPRREALRQQDLTDNAKANIGELGSAAEFTSSRPSLTKNLKPVAVQVICLEVCGMLRRGSPATPSNYLAMNCELVGVGIQGSASSLPIHLIMGHIC